MSAEDPICDGCGERHPKLTIEQILQIAAANVLDEAIKVAESQPGAFPELEEAISYVNRVAAVIIARELSNGPKPSKPDLGGGA